MEPLINYTEEDNVSYAELIYVIKLKYVVADIILYSKVSVQHKRLSFGRERPHSVGPLGGFLVHNTCYPKYSLNFKRQPIYYTCVMLVPTFVTATICLLGLFVPAVNTGERIEKVNMGPATLLSMAIILGIVSGEMPKSTTLPLLGFYVLAELIICTIGVSLSMLIMVAHQRVTTRVLVPPRWINIIVLFKFHEHKKPEKTDVSPVHTEKIIMSETEEQTSHQIENIKNILNIKRLNEVLDSVQKFIDDKTFEEYLLLQWAIIFDRVDTFFLVLFNFVNIIMSGVLLLS